MHSVSQLEKQQVGLRLPKYLTEEIGALTNQFSIFGFTQLVLQCLSESV